MELIRFFDIHMSAGETIQTQLSFLLFDHCCEHGFESELNECALSFNLFPPQIITIDAFHHNNVRVFVCGKSRNGQQKAEMGNKFKVNTAFFKAIPINEMYIFTPKFTQYSTSI